MALPLKKTIYITGVAVALVLAVLLSLGIRQYQLYKAHEHVTEQSEKLIFQFAIIREHVTESLLEDRYSGLAGVADEMEKLNGNLSRILSNKHIGEEYKLSFVNSIDLPSIILLLRKIETGPVEQENLRQLNIAVRTLGERLMLFDRVLVNYAKRKLIGFQNIVIGALAIVVCMVIIILLVFHKQVVTPLVNLVKQVKGIALGRRETLTFDKKFGEISELAHSFGDLLESRDSTMEWFARYQQVFEAVKRVQQAVSLSESAEELFRDVCRSLLFNKDYCLVWIGRPDADGKDVVPVSADGSTSMSNKECDTCMAVLLTAVEEKGFENNPAAQALQAGKAIVNRDILLDIPKGLLKGTPLEDGHASCAAIPMRWHDKRYGVLSVYGISQDSFDEKEVELLESMAGDLALALHSFEEAKQQEQQRDLHKKILEAMEGILITIAPDGAIVSMNDAAERLSGYSSKEMFGKNWQKLLMPLEKEQPKGKQDILLFLPGMEETQMFMASRENKERLLRCRFVATPPEYSGKDHFLCIGREVPKRNVNTSDLVKASRLSILGELAAGVAHEISDLSNGVINYAQVMADEISDAEENCAQLDILNKISGEGERIANIAGKLIFYGQEQRQAGGYLAVADVLADSLLLVDYQLKQDGIRLRPNLPNELPAVRVNAQHMQQVFLNLVNNARHALNLRYPGKDPDKRLEIRGEIIAGDGQEWLRISFTDTGSGIDSKNIDMVFEPEFAAKKSDAATGQGLRISRDVVRQHGGLMFIESELGKFTTVNVDLPIG